MKVSEFIEWLKTQDQDLYVNIIEVDRDVDYIWTCEDEYCVSNTTASVEGFDNPERQSSVSKISLTLGVEG